jgi:hypothetical protein
MNHTVRLCLVGLLAWQVWAAKIPDEILKTVTFIYVSADGKTAAPNGTGFFVGVKIENKDAFAVYLVTAKHVLTDANGKYFDEVGVRLNTLAGKSELLRLPLGANVFTHPSEEDVDIAVVPALPDQKVFDFKFLPEEMLTTKAGFTEMKIGPGSDVFFAGLFTGFLGQNRSYPIARFGRVALVTDEKVPWQEPGHPQQMLDLYLLETQSFGGNSGSPVFFYLGSDREPGSIMVGPPVLKLAGIMKGNFNQGAPIVVMNNSPQALALQNMGIAAVVPAYLLHEVLFQEKLLKARAAH